jgi:hypothetical protein
MSPGPEPTVRTTRALTTKTRPTEA